MHAALGLALHRTGPLQGLLHPRVTQPDLMFLAQPFVKMPHVQIEVLVPVQAQNFFRAFAFATRRRLGIPPLRSSKPLCHCSSSRFRQRRSCRGLMPINSAARHHLISPPRLSTALCITSSPALRTFHLLKTPDILCANDIRLCVSYYSVNCRLGGDRPAIAKKAKSPVEDANKSCTQESLRF
jgi:hypothetical protein